jgi:hypothetical protein
MESQDFKECVAEWLKLQKAGEAKEAKEYYYANLFDNVIKQFNAREKGSMDEPVDVLFSILGFSPEPIVLGAKLLQPKTHTLVST